MPHHSDLLGLGQDDHPHYLNEARGTTLISANIGSAVQDALAAILPTSTTVGRMARYTDTAGAQGQTTSLFEANSGNVGIGTTTPSAALEILNVGPIKITDSGGNAYLQNSDTWGMKWKFSGESNTMEMNQANTAWQSNINNTGGGVIRFRWNTTKTTSGFTGPMVDFNVNGTNIFYGSVGIGTTAPVVKLDCDGPIRCKSYTVATKPSAAAGAGQIIYLTDEAGGAIHAGSDGTNWRRFSDNAIVS